LGLQRVHLHEYDNIKDFILFASDDKEKSGSIAEYVQETMKLVDISTIKEMLSSLPKQVDEETRDYIMSLFDKIRLNKTSARDIFKLLDKLGDDNGSIGILEFQIASNRLGTPLTQHRVLEIFSDVKMEKVNDADAGEMLELDEDEWLKALEYLKRRQVSHAMSIMGISPEVLYATFVYLLLLILLIFSFIFVGIKAFAIGGAFGAVINSILPGVAAMGVGSHDDTKGKFSKDGAKEACRMSRAILHAKHDAIME